MTAVHKFDPGNNRDGEDWWANVYRRAFTGYVTHETVSDVKLQKAGIDHRVRLEGGGEVLVDVKVRDRWYPDVLVEVWSDRDRKIAGWARKPLRCHYIAYAFPGSEVAFLVPFHLLQLAYEQNKQEWARLANDRAENGFRVVDADNGSYVTRSVAVPIERLTADVAGAMTVYFFESGEPFA